MNMFFDENIWKSMDCKLFYQCLCFRPMDLSTIKKNIEAGVSLVRLAIALTFFCIFEKLRHLKWCVYLSCILFKKLVVTIVSLPLWFVVLCS